MARTKAASVPPLSVHRRDAAPRRARDPPQATDRLPRRWDPPARHVEHPPMVNDVDEPGPLFREAAPLSEPS